MRSLLLTLLLCSWHTLALYCPNGAMNQYNKRCLVYMASPLPFIAAEQTCVGMRGHLVDIDSAFDNAIIADYISNVYPVPSSVWLGGSDRCSQQGWEWIDWTPVNYARWDSAQPDISAGQCIAMQSASGKWRVAPCSDAKPFVCATPPSSSPFPATCPPCPDHPSPTPSYAPWTEPVETTPAFTYPPSSNCFSHGASVYAALLLDTYRYTEAFAMFKLFSDAVAGAIHLGNGVNAMTIAGVNKAFTDYPYRLEQRSQNDVSSAIDYIRDNTDIDAFDGFQLADGIRSFLLSSLSDPKPTPNPFLIVFAGHGTSDLSSLPAQLAAVKARGYTTLVVTYEGAIEYFTNVVGLPAENVHETTNEQLGYNDAMAFLVDRMCNSIP